MLKPSVGLIVVMSSPFSRFTIVVLPALSSPLCAQQKWRGCQIVSLALCCQPCIKLL
jgi:hypothetical protein